MHPWHRAEHMCFLDTNHEWSGSHAQYDDGKMDGFYETNHGEKGEVLPAPATSLRDGGRAMTWYDERELPYYYALAKSFGLGDHYFCSLLGPTWPNRMYLFAATSFGQTTNTFADIGAHPFPQSDAVVLDELDKRHVDWKLYTAGGSAGRHHRPRGAAPRPLRAQRPLHDGGLLRRRRGRQAPAGRLPRRELHADGQPRRRGRAPAVERAGRAALHEPHRRRALQEPAVEQARVLHDVRRARRASTTTSRPRKACAPDEKTPLDKNGAKQGGAFDRYGMRVPFLVVSPYAKRGYVSHGVYDHSSIVRFIQAKHRLPALTARDANAAIPTDFFDFQSPPNLDIPGLPEAVVDPAEKQYCDQTFAK